MEPVLKGRVIKSLQADRKVRRGVVKHTHSVLLHISEEQYVYLQSKVVPGSKQGCGSYMRKLLIIDMERSKLRAENAESHNQTAIQV